MIIFPFCVSFPGVIKGNFQKIDFFVLYWPFPGLASDETHLFQLRFSSPMTLWRLLESLIITNVVLEEAGAHTDGRDSLCRVSTRTSGFYSGFEFSRAQ